MMGSTTATGDLSPIYLFLFLGVLVGGLGTGALLLACDALPATTAALHQEPRR